jgi:hypothetical protein
LVTKAFLCCSLLIGVAASASAQLARSFVSVTGDDGNPCYRLLPCRSLNRATSQTAANGEVIVLDSGQYDGMVITTAITITAPPYVQAVITAAGGGGVVFTINAGPSDEVVLCGLDIDGIGGATTYGIEVLGVGTLLVDRCVIHGITGVSGILFSTAGRLSVQDTEVRDCGFAGIDVSPGSLGPATAVITKCRLFRNPQFGVRSGDNATVAVSDSILAWNGAGVTAWPQLGSGAELNVENCIIHGNKFYGVENVGTGTSGGGIVRVADSVITDGELGLAATLGSTILTRGDNTVEGNWSADLYGTIATYSPR